MIGLINMFLYLLWFWVLNCPDIVMPWYCNFSNRQKFGSKISHLKTPPTYPEIPQKVKSRHCSYKMLWILKHTSKWFQFTCGIVACQEANPLKEQASPWSLHCAGKDVIHFKISQHPSKIESILNCSYLFLHHLGHLIPFGRWPNLFWRPDDSFTVLSVFLFCKRHSQSQLNLEMELCQTPVKLGFCQWGSWKSSEMVALS